MVSRLVTALLLATLLFWMSGAAQYVHELVEHQGHLHIATKITATNPASQPQKHDDDDDDCPICQLLAHLNVDYTVFPAPAIADHLPVCVALLTDQYPPAYSIAPSAPIRGPPQAV